MSSAGILAGYGADLVLGDPARGHPVAAFGRLAATLERRLWRPHPAAGVVHTGLLVGATGGAVAGIERGLTHRRGARAALLAAVVWAALGGRSLRAEGRQMAALLRRGDLAAARRRAPALVGREVRHLDEQELTRATIESLAENTADAVVGPLLWAALAGPAGATTYRAVNTLDAMVGHRSARYGRFGWAAARLDDLLSWPAARVGALLAAALAGAVGGSPRRALAALRRYGGRHPSPNAGRMEASFAGALGVRLGGPNTYGDRVEDRPQLGDGPRPRPEAIEQAVRLSALVGAAAALLAAGSGEAGR